MRIPINKDIETAYKDEFVKGFTLREALSVAIAAGLILGVTVVAWKVSGLGPEVCIYIGLPFGLLPIFFGFKKFQGLTAYEYIMERIYEKKTRVLAYDTGETAADCGKFTMERQTKKGRRKKRNEKRPI